MNQGLDLGLYLDSLVITGDVCQAEIKKSGTLSDQESQLNPQRAKKFWMVGYKWRGLHIIKKGIIVYYYQNYGMELYEKNEVLRMKRSLLS